MTGVKRRRRLVGVAVGAIVIITTAVLLVRWLPALVVTAVLAAPRLEPWAAPWLGDVAREDVEIPFPAKPLAADLYHPVRSRPPRSALVLVHGLSTDGRRQPDLARLARLLGRSGLLVVVPQFDGLAAFRLSGREVEEIGAVLGHVQRHAPAVGIAGFSFGAGPVLLAAAGRNDVALVGSFGGYADLGNVGVFIASGAHTFGGTRYVERSEPYNRWKLASLLTPFVPDDVDRVRLASIVDAKLRDPGADTSVAEGTLARNGRAVLSLVRSRDETEARRRLAELPASARAALEKLSPLSAVPKIRGRLLIAHGAADPSIPFTESLRLAEATGGRTRAVILGGFHHTGATDLWRAIADVWRLVGLVDSVIALR
jgi:pimeloyl-ACP methyl ester carboxylesterase